MLIAGDTFNLNFGDWVIVANDDGTSSLRMVSRLQLDLFDEFLVVQVTQTDYDKIYDNGSRVFAINRDGTLVSFYQSGRHWPQLNKTKTGSEADVVDDALIAEWQGQTSTNTITRLQELAETPLTHGVYR